MIRWLLAGKPEDLDERLAAVFGRRKLAATQVDTKTFAYYRFVDLFKAADEYFATRQDVATLESGRRRRRAATAWWSGCDMPPTWTRPS